MQPEQAQIQQGNSTVMDRLSGGNYKHLLRPTPSLDFAKQLPLSICVAKR